MASNKDGEENLLDDLLHKSHEEDHLFLEDEKTKKDDDEGSFKADDNHSDISDEESRHESDISEDEAEEDRKMADQVIDGKDAKDDDIPGEKVSEDEVSGSASDSENDKPPAEKEKERAESPPKKLRKGKSYDYATKLNYLFRDARFFLVKSNNSENVTLSKAKGVWSTPPANESRFNKAFEDARNVLLIFSVKESGKFSGFARLANESRRDGPQVSWVLPPGLSARALGGVFKIDWVCRKVIDYFSTSCAFSRKIFFFSKFCAFSRKIMGFLLKLLRFFPQNKYIFFLKMLCIFPQNKLLFLFSSKDLSFQKVQHLYNPWNEGKPIKIGRDGQEIEPSKDLFKEFFHSF